MTKMQEVKRWVADAVQDGWSWRKTYEYEDVTTAVTLTKNGYTAMAVMRPVGFGEGQWKLKKEYVSLHVWGPDKLAVSPPTAYDWGTLELRARMCSYCNKVGPTVRIGFAGRCCASCHASHVNEVEYPGWDD